MEVLAVPDDLGPTAVLPALPPRRSPRHGSLAQGAPRLVELSIFFFIFGRDPVSRLLKKNL